MRGLRRVNLLLTARDARPTTAGILPPSAPSNPQACRGTAFEQVKILRKHKDMSAREGLTSFKRKAENSTKAKERDRRMLLTTALMVVQKLLLGLQRDSSLIWGYCVDLRVLGACSFAMDCFLFF